MTTRPAGVVVVWLVAVVLGSTAPAVAATQKPHPPTIGSTIRTSTAAVTLRAYRKQVTARGSAPTTSPVTAINVQICNTSSASLPVRRDQFFLEAQDRHLFFPAPTPTVPEPQLETTPLARSRCLRRWVSYALPAGTQPTFVVFQAGAMFTATLHKWTLPSA
jgi:hypothetical protein